MSSDRFGPALPPSMAQSSACETSERDTWMQGESSMNFLQSSTFTNKDIKRQKKKDREESPEYDYSAPGLHIMKKSSSMNKRLFSSANIIVSASNDSKSHVEKMKARFRRDTEEKECCDRKSKSKHNNFRAPAEREYSYRRQNPSDRSQCPEKPLKSSTSAKPPSPIKHKRESRHKSRSPSRKHKERRSRSTSPRSSKVQRHEKTLLGRNQRSQSRSPDKIEKNRRSESRSPNKIEKNWRSEWKSADHRSRNDHTHQLIGKNSGHSSTVESSGNEQHGHELGKSTENTNQPGKMLTDDDLNKLSAKILKAEISGNAQKVEKLTKKLNEMKQMLKTQSIKSSGARDEIVILTKTDLKGNIRPVDVEAVSSNHDSRGKRRKKEKIIKTHDDSGERDKYFPDDKNKDLSDLLTEERELNKLGQDQLFMKYAGKLSKMSSDRQNWTIDDMFESNIAKEKSTGSKDMEQLRSKNQREHKQLESCNLCLDKCSKESIVHIGKTLYVKVPHLKSMTKFQCQIVPVDHIIASVNGDEDFWDELKNTKSSLVNSFASKKLDTIFLESAQNLGKRHHIVIDCIPVPMDEGALLPAYFKKEIMDCDVEWAQNKKLIDTRKKSLKRSIPQGLPFFSVEFGTDGGFAHVIEDERLFKRYFGLQIVGGVLDCDVNLWRNPAKETPEGLKYKKRVFEKLSIKFC